MITAAKSSPHQGIFLGLSSLWCLKISLLCDDLNIRGVSVAKASKVESRNTFSSLSGLRFLKYFKLSVVCNNLNMSDGFVAKNHTTFQNHPRSSV